jgi:hypothetical protein
VQIWTRRELNLGAPTATGTYIIKDSSGAQVSSFTTPLWTTASKIDTRYGHINEVDNGGQSWYNALALQLRKRFSHGLSAGVSYTWSHAIDDANQSGAANGVISFTQYSLEPGNYGLDKGSSGLDQRHRAAINFMWAPKFTSSNSAAARYLVNGWELSAITTLASAQPVSGTVASVSTGNGSVFPGVQLAYSTMNGTGGWNRVPFWPVDSIDIDRTYRVDARITRNIPISERVKAMLMFEAFNAFNTQYNTTVYTQAYSVSGNVLTPVNTLGLGNQSQGFPDGTNARRMQAAFRLTF